MDSDWLVDGPAGADRTVVLAHGAGAPMDSPFMEHFARGLGARGHRVVRFEFPYMQRRRTTGKGGVPDRAAVLEQTWRQVVGALDAPDRLIIGGKSMGGRVASVLADELGVAGLVCLGYPFHPPGKPDKLRVAHLRQLRTPCLIAQGTRDNLGKREEVQGYPLAPSIELHWLEDGDHSFKPRKKSGRTLEENLDEALQAVVRFVEAR